MEAWQIAVTEWTKQWMKGNPPSADHTPHYQKKDAPGAAKKSHPVLEGNYVWTVPELDMDPKLRNTKENEVLGEESWMESQDGD